MCIQESYPRIAPATGVLMRTPKLMVAKPCPRRVPIRGKEDYDGRGQGDVDARKEFIQDSNSDDTGLVIHTDKREGDNRSAKGAGNDDVE